MPDFSSRSVVTSGSDRLSICEVIWASFWMTPSPFLSITFSFRATLLIAQLSCSNGFHLACVCKYNPHTGQRTVEMIRSVTERDSKGPGAD